MIIRTEFIPKTFPIPLSLSLSLESRRLFYRSKIGRKSRKVDRDFNVVIRSRFQVTLSPLFESLTARPAGMPSRSTLLPPRRSWADVITRGGRAKRNYHPLHNHLFTSFPMRFPFSCRPARFRSAPLKAGRHESIYHSAHCAAEKWISITWGRSIAFLFSFTGIKGQPDYRDARWMERQSD